MAPSLFTLPVLVILFLLNICLLYLCIYVRSGRKYCWAIPFFVCGLITVAIQLLIEFNNDPAFGIFLSKLQYVFFWAYFITAPILISALTEEKLQSSVAIVFLSCAVIAAFLTSFSNAIISSDSLFYAGLWIAKTGRLYPVVATLLFILCIYYYGKFMRFVNNIKSLELQFIMPFGLGLCIIAGMVDYVGKMNGAPIISWLRDPFSIGMFAISLSFFSYILFCYSNIVSEYQHSLKDIEKLLQKNYQTLGEFVQLIAKTIDAKDKYTAGHSIRVAEYAIRIARILNLDEHQIEILRQACLLHDIGKIGIPDGVLNKKSPLTAKDRAHIYRHPVLAREILKHVTDLQEVLDIIYAHHERIDGSGYPQGLTKEQIPLLARILSVADAYDAMLSERPYRQPKTKLAAIKELLALRDRQFDALVVNKFVEIMCLDEQNSVNHSAD